MPVRELVPASLRRLLRRVRDAALSLAYVGGARHCPVCDLSSRRFADYGVPPRPEALCMRCGALERHRLLWLCFARRTDLFDGRRKRVLHLAPEPALRRRLSRRLGPGYLTADLLNRDVSVRTDLGRTAFADGAFDVLLCSHVLQYVPDDRRALAELRRLLAPGGWAAIVVPITVERTREREEETDAEERRRLFEGDYHARRYGPDFAERLAAAGLAATAVSTEDLVAPADRQRLGLAHEPTRIYLCRPA